MVTWSFDLFFNCTFNLQIRPFSFFQYCCISKKTWNLLRSHHKRHLSIHEAHGHVSISSNDSEGLRLVNIFFDLGVIGPCYHLIDDGWIMHQLQEWWWSRSRGKWWWGKVMVRELVGVHFHSIQQPWDNDTSGWLKRLAIQACMALQGWLRLGSEGKARPLLQHVLQTNDERKGPGVNHIPRIEGSCAHQLFIVCVVLHDWQHFATLGIKYVKLPNIEG